MIGQGGAEEVRVGLARRRRGNSLRGAATSAGEITGRKVHLGACFAFDFSFLSRFACLDTHAAAAAAAASTPTGLIQAAAICGAARLASALIGWIRLQRGWRLCHVASKHTHTHGGSETHTSQAAWVNKQGIPTSNHRARGRLGGGVCVTFDRTDPPCSSPSPGRRRQADLWRSCTDHSVLRLFDDGGLGGGWAQAKSPSNRSITASVLQCVWVCVCVCVWYEDASEILLWLDVSLSSPLAPISTPALTLVTGTTT